MINKINNTTTNTKPLPNPPQEATGATGAAYPQPQELYPFFLYLFNMQIQYN